MDINYIMRQLAEYTRIAEETAAIIESYKDQLKQYMQELNTDTLIGDEHKATYTLVVSNRIDTAALKKDMPETVKAYTKQVSTKRFTFA